MSYSSNRKLTHHVVLLTPSRCPSPTTPRALAALLACPNPIGGHDSRELADFLHGLSP